MEGGGWNLGLGSWLKGGRKREGDLKRKRKKKRNIKKEKKKQHVGIGIYIFEKATSLIHMAIKITKLAT